MNTNKGFTTVETMTVVAVMSVLLAIATPSYTDSIERTKVVKAADMLNQVANFAKYEALRTNKVVYFKVTNTASCLSSTSAQTCDIRNDAFSDAITVTMTDTAGNAVTGITFDEVRGLPSSPIVLTVVLNAKHKAVTVNLLGLVTTGAIT